VLEVTPTAGPLGVGQSGAYVFCVGGYQTSILNTSTGGALIYTSPGSLKISTSIGCQSGVAWWMYATGNYGKYAFGSISTSGATQSVTFGATVVLLVEVEQELRRPTTLTRRRARTAVLVPRPVSPVLLLPTRVVVVVVAGTPRPPLVVLAVEAPVARAARSPERTGSAAGLERGLATTLVATSLVQRAGLASWSSAIHSHERLTP